MEKEKKNHYDLNMPVQYLRGVGPQISKKLAKLGIRTLEDLLYYVPRTWEDRRQFCPLRDAQPDREMTFRGKIADLNLLETASGYAVVSALIEDSTGRLVCKWMRKKSFKYDVLQPFKKEFRAGVQLIVHGKVVQDFADKLMQVEEYEVLTNSNEDFVHIDRIVPIYSLTEGLRQRFLRNLIYDALLTTPVTDALPRTLCAEADLMPLAEALHKIHFPENFDEKEKARKRLAFQELFMIQMVLAIARKRRRVARSCRYAIKRNLLTPFREKCGFEFTPSQKKVIREVFNDLTSEFPMNRLLQGDVGSGKTIVALSAMLLAAENNFQSALMAPTEILAEQHYITIKHFLGSLPVRVGLLTGSVQGKERKKFLEECGQGKMDIAIGTHALLEKEVQFLKLRLAVIDEQHRFGVRHRLALTQPAPSQSSQPGDREVTDILVMTATPIPRTLALGLYGDLDLSVIDGLPPGREKIETVLKTEAEAYAILKDQIKKQRQAYIVYPLVDESDKLELKAAIQEFEKLKAETFRGFSIGLLHGQMSGKEKEKIMKDFYDQQYSILVATTVVEVGIDVPNATAMLIQHAERFGLSTLHQLRGRVGRGSEHSYCILVAQPKTDEAKERIKILLQTQNGFELAEKDMELRGPGEILGTSQHGLPPFKIAHLIADRLLIPTTHKMARQCLENDPELNQKENALLKEYLRKHFSKNWHWANIA